MTEKRLVWLEYINVLSPALLLSNNSNPFSMRFNLSLVTLYLASVALATVIPVDSASGHGYGYGEPGSSSTDIAEHSSAAHGGIQSTGVTQPVPPTTTEVGTAPHSSGIASQAGGSQSSAIHPDPQSSDCGVATGGPKTAIATTMNGTPVTLTRTVTIIQKPSKTQKPAKSPIKRPVSVSKAS